MSKVNQKHVKGASGLMALASKTVKKAAKKDDKDMVMIDEATNKEVYDALDVYVQAKKDVDAATSRLETASGIIKEHAKEIWVAEVEKTSRPKESFLLSNDKGSTAMYAVTDAYKRSNLDDERIEYLQDKFGEDIISPENKFIINPELVDKYGQVLCEMIQNSKKIAEDDKALLIQLEQKNVITKGTINRMKEIAAKAKTTVLELFNEIMPTCQLKARGK